MAIDLWSLKSEFYDALRTLPLVRRILEQETEKLKMLVKGVPLESSWILEVGTGTGLALEVLPEGISVVGLDRSLRMVLKARSKRRITGIVGKACRLPLREGIVPFVSAVGLTEYLPDKGAFLDEVKRVVHSGGYFLVTIAPPGALNFLRNLLGSQIYSVGAESWETTVRKRGFTCIGFEKTVLQVQYLFVLQMGTDRPRNYKTTARVEK